MSLKNRRIMVCGGAGFIGSHTVDKIVENNPEKVVIVDNFFLGKMRNIKEALKKENVTFYKEDCKNKEKMNEIIRNEAIDSVFNFAVMPLPYSLVRPIQCYQENVRIVEILGELLYENAYETLIHISSSEACGNAPEIPTSENSPLRPMTTYAASKAASDHLIMSLYRTFGLDVSIVRPFNNYGPRQNEKSYAGVIPTTIKRICNGEKPIIFGDGLQTRDYIYVEDTAEAIISVYMHQNTRGKIIHIASGKEITIKDLIKNICNLMEYEGDIMYGKERPGDVRRQRADISLAKKLINFQPKTSLDVGLAKTVEWYKKVLRC